MPGGRQGDERGGGGEQRGAGVLVEVLSSPCICCEPRLILHEVPGAMRSGGSLGTAGPHRAVRVSA